jgi:surface antigen
LDQWKFYQGQCTSWVAYELNHLNSIAFTDYYGGKQWGDASNWKATAQSEGIAVDGNPGLGSIAWYSADHVAYVEQVNSPTSIIISEMNYDYHNGFWVHTVTAGGSGWPTNFIHIRDRSGTVADGTFVQVSGHPEIYRIAGGAPLYVSSWAAFGGPQPYTVISQSQFNSLRQYPADGTFVSSRPDGYVFRFAGGAPLYVSNWDRVGGSHPTIAVDLAALQNGDGPSPWNHVHRYPADGTFVSTNPGGYVFRFAGGAPLYVSTWNHVGGAQPTTAVDLAAIDNADGPVPWNHVHRYPANGTFVSTNPGGYVYRFAGGAPLYVSTWTAFGGAQPTTVVDEAAIDHAGTLTDPWNHVRIYPVNGTFLRGQDGTISRVAGGAALHITSCTPPDIDSCGGYIEIDEAAVTKAGGSAPWNHLRARPADSTVIETVPSGSYFSYKSGLCSRTRASSAAVAVNDNSVDCTPPAVSLARLGAARLDGAVRLSWSGSDTGSGVASYQLRYRRARDDSGFRSWQYPAPWKGLTGTSLTMTGLAQGYDYCFAARAVDRAGNASAWTSSQCTARALDDRALTASVGWRRATASRWWNGTVTITKQKGAKLTLLGARLDRVGIVATRCESCGSVAVFVGSTRIGSVSLHAATTRYRQLVLLPRFPYRTGTVAIKVISSGRPVQIDGAVVSRS